MTFVRPEAPATTRTREGGMPSAPAMQPEHGGVRGALGRRRCDADRERAVATPSIVSPPARGVTRTGDPNVGRVPVRPHGSAADDGS